MLDSNNNFSSSTDSLESILDVLGSELKKVDEIIIKNCEDKSELIKDVVKHLVLSGGKRIRPIITIISGKICGRDDDIRQFNLAAAVELIHTATLLHDDVIDGSNLRRGKQTANSLWGNKASILVGDYLLSVAFQLMVKDGSLEILDLLSRVSGIMSNGEVLQLMNSTNIDITETDYLEIINSKTGILFSAAAQIGAIINNNHKQQIALREFGANLGVAFQIVDDALDYSSNKKDLGKNIGDDFYEGKITLPVIITYKRANKEEKLRLKSIFAGNLSDNQKDESLLKEVISLMNKYQAIESSISKAVDYQSIARHCLDIFADSREKKMLLSILEYAVKRQN